MKATPTFLGACAFASIAGAVGGATTNTDPIQRGGIGSELLPEHYYASHPSDGGLFQQPPLPDHYAMTTPEGRIEVAELSTRGLYAQQRFGWRETSYEPLPEPDFEDSAAAWDEPPAVENFAEPVAPPQPTLEVPAAQDVPTVESRVRVIDVAATLVARQ